WHGKRGPARHLRAVERDGNLGARHRHPARVRELEPRPQEGALEPGGAGGIADEAVGEHEGLAVHGARRGDSHPELSRATEILDGGERTGVEHAEPHRASVTRGW